MCYSRNKEIESHPEIFNPAHIAYVKQWQAITAGEVAIDFIHEDAEDEGATRFKFECPVCGNHQRPKYKAIMYRKDGILNFQCHNCLSNFYADYHNEIFFKSQTNIAN